MSNFFLRILIIINSKNKSSIYEISNETFGFKPVIQDFLLASKTINEIMIGDFVTNLNLQTQIDVLIFLKVIITKKQNHSIEALGLNYFLLANFFQENNEFAKIEKSFDSFFDFIANLPSSISKIDLSSNLLNCRENKFKQYCEIINRNNNDNNNENNNNKFHSQFIKVLNLSYNQIDHKAMEHLTSLSFPRLEELDLSGNK